MKLIFFACSEGGM